MPRNSPDSPEYQLNPNQLWHAVQTELQRKLSRANYENWVAGAQLVGFENDRATIGSQNIYITETLQNRFAGAFSEAVSRVTGRPATVAFVVIAGREPNAGQTDNVPVSDPATDREDSEAPDAPAARPPRPAARTQRPARSIGNDAGRGSGVPPARQIPLSAAPPNGLNPRYIYDTYVVGSSNRFAHAASLSVAENPGGQFNPFFIHGGVGLGKTHLMHAIGHRALELRSDLTISYVTSEKFTNDLVAAIRQQRMDDFRGRYREIDILMIDDVQFIAGKESTQEEFFHTFNTLYQSGKQVIITSDRPPKAISALEDRLRSRFDGGLTADVQLPDFEMRTAILRAKSEELRVALPAEVVEYIASRDQSNIRELEGALNKVVARAQLTDRPIGLPLAMEALTDSAMGGRRTKVTRESVISAVSRGFGVEPSDLTGRSRRREIVVPRHIAMYLLREETSASLLEIGRELGGRDHTTVMNGIEKIESSLANDTGLRSRIMAIREELFAAGSR